MSTSITAIYDRMVQRVAALIPAAVRLPNPYKPQENPDLLLKNGFGVTIGPSANTKRMIYPKLSQARTMTVVLTRKMYAVESAAEAKGVAEKALLEDQLLVLKDFHADTTLNGSAVRAAFETDNGVEYVSTERDQYIMIQTSFSVEYLEDFI